MKIIDMMFVENAKRAVNIYQPKRRRGEKSGGTCIFDVFHGVRSYKEKAARTRRSAKHLFEKQFLQENTVSVKKNQDLLLCQRYQEKNTKTRTHQKKEVLKRGEWSCP